MSDYEINIFYSDEDDGYVAEIRDLPMCSAFGETPSEALAELETARDAWIAAAKADGRPVPKPRRRAASTAS